MNVVLQRFIEAVIDKYKSINPEKEGGSVRGAMDLKNEL